MRHYETDMNTERAKAGSLKLEGNRLVPDTPQENAVNDLQHTLASVLNRFSAENASNTPDFILAQYLLGCLAAWNQAVQQRETWYGRDARPRGGSGLYPIGPAEEG